MGQSGTVLLNYSIKFLESKCFRYSIVFDDKSQLRFGRFWGGLKVFHVWGFNRFVLLSYHFIWFIYCCSQSFCSVSLIVKFLKLLLKYCINSIRTTNLILPLSTLSFSTIVTPLHLINSDSILDVTIPHDECLVIATRSLPCEVVWPPLK